MTLPFDHTHDLDLGVSRSESEIALSQEWGGRLTWNEKDVSHPFKTMILSSVTIVGWADVLDIDRGDFRRRRVVDISSSNWIQFFSPRDLEIWWMTSKSNRVPLLFYTKLCASFQIYWWIQTGVTVRKRSIMVKIGGFFFCCCCCCCFVYCFVPCDLEILGVTLKNNRAPLLYHIKLCPSFQSYRWIQTSVTTRKSSI